MKNIYKTILGLLLLTPLAALAATSTAQWYTTSSPNIFPFTYGFNTKVGIGTSSPFTQLTLDGAGNEASGETFGAGAGAIIYTLWNDGNNFNFTSRNNGAGSSVIFNSDSGSPSVAFSMADGSISQSNQTATNTGQRGWNITGGCFAINGTCVGGSGGAVNSVSNSDGTLTISPTTGSVVASLALAHANTWTGLQSLFGGASTTALSANFAEFGGTATTTFTRAGAVGVASTSPWGLFSINPNALGSGVPEFVIGSSTKTHLLVNSGGEVLINRITPVDTTAMLEVNESTQIHAIRIDGSGGGVSVGTYGDGVFAANGTIAAQNTFTTVNNSMILNTGVAGRDIIFQPAAIERARFNSSNGSGGLGFGTTTSAWQVQIATSTGAGFKPQFTLTDNGAATNQKHWSMYSQGGLFGIATSSDAYATSSTAALTINKNGSVGIASSSPMGTAPGLALPGNFYQYGSYAHFGTAVSPFTCVAQSCLELTGNDNTTDGVQFQAFNNNPGTSAYTGYSMGNDKADSNLTNFAGIYLNSSTYSDTTFGTGEAIPYGMILQNSMGPLYIDVSTTSAPNSYITLNTGGSASANERMRITSTGFTGFGTTSPWGLFSIQDITAAWGTPSFIVATSTSYFSQLFALNSTSTELNANTSYTNENVQSGVRAMVGYQDSWFGTSTPPTDELSVNGRINTGRWSNMNCEVGTLQASVNTDTNNACGQYNFQIDNAGQWQPGQVSTEGMMYTTMQVTGATANNGVGIWPAPYLFLVSATNTPVIEASVRVNPVNASSTKFYIGFVNKNPTGSTYETEPTAGCYFTASSTQANWQAVCRTSGANITQINTGYASSSSVTANGQFYRLKVEMGNNIANFFIQNADNSALVQVAQITTNVPSTVATAAGVYLANDANTGLNKFLDVGPIRFWWRNILAPDG
jgi:hypothetical protein